MQIIIPAQLSGTIKKLTKARREGSQNCSWSAVRAAGPEHRIFFSFDITCGIAGDKKFGWILRVGILATLTEQHSF